MVLGLFRRRGAETEAAPTSSELRPEATQDSDMVPVPVARRPEAPSPLLWQNTAYGMTVEEVLATRPDAAPSGDRQMLHNGAVSELRIPTLRLAEHDYSVLFYFLHGSLSQVTIATKGGPTLNDFHAVANALRLRYGREVSFKENPTSFSTGEWLSADGINVVIAFHGEIDCLNINFQYRYADAATQL